MKAVVFGEIGMDMLIHTIPAPPTVSTVRGSHFDLTPGGRGANQAVALARLGMDVHLVGRVGSDDFGRQLLRHLPEMGVRIDSVQVDTGSTCVTILGIDADGDYFAVAKVLGANDRVDRDDVAKFTSLLDGAALAMFQFGVPAEQVVAAAAAAAGRGVRTVLDPTPVPAGFDPALARSIDVVTPNEREVRLLTGIELSDEAACEAAVRRFHDWGFRAVVLKLGARGAYASSAEERRRVPAFSVQAVDTVGAGDAFNAGLALGLVEGASLVDAVRWGAAAGALAVTEAGAQNALPDLEALRNFLAA